jgi:hypothetical protein
MGTFGHKKRKKYDMECFIMISFVINVIFPNVAVTQSYVGLAESVYFPLDIFNVILKLEQ